RRRERVQAAAVERARAAAPNPVRHAHAQGEAGWARAMHRELRRLLEREPRSLHDAHAALLPIQLGCDEEVDVDARVVVKVDAVAELGVRFEARSVAAPERLV